MIFSNQEAFQYLQENVSRETMEALSSYCALLKKWNQSINLVSPYSIPEIWLRHILDSYQISSHITGDFADLGSGAGFPGLVVALTTRKSVSLIEADEKKCAFLRTVSRETNVPCQILNDRMEKIDKVFNQITARALASIDQIFEISQHIRDWDTEYVLLKGENVDKEIEEAEKKWYFSYSLIPSITLKKSYIIKIKNIRKK